MLKLSLLINCFIDAFLIGFFLVLIFLYFIDQIEEPLIDLLVLLLFLGDPQIDLRNFILNGFLLLSKSFD